MTHSIVKNASSPIKAGNDDDEGSDREDDKDENE